MSAIDFIKDSFDSIHGSFRDARVGQSDEQIHFVPDGESHSVAWILFHTTRIEDLMINGICQDKPHIFVEGNYAERIGFPTESFGTGQTTEEAREGSHRRHGRLHRVRRGRLRRDRRLPGRHDRRQRA